MPGGCLRGPAHDRQRQVGEPLEGEAGQVDAVLVEVPRAVEVRPGVRHHVDAADVERRAAAEPFTGLFTADVGGDVRRRQPGVGRHPGDDVVAEVDELCHGDGYTGASSWRRGSWAGRLVVPQVGEEIVAQ